MALFCWVLWASASQAQNSACQITEVITKLTSDILLGETQQNDFTEFCVLLNGWSRDNINIPLNVLIQTKGLLNQGRSL